MLLTKIAPKLWKVSREIVVILADVPTSYSFLVADLPCVVIDIKLEDWERDLVFWELSFRGPVQ
jgi:hypothetical protein